MADTEDGGTHPIIPIPRRQRLLGRKQLNYQTRFRLLVTCLVAGIVATILFLAAMGTTDWVRLHYPSGLYRPSTSSYVERQVAKNIMNIFNPFTADPVKALHFAIYWSNPPFLIFDIRALRRSVLSAGAPECQKLKMMG